MQIKKESHSTALFFGSIFAVDLGFGEFRRREKFSVIIEGFMLHPLDKYYRFNVCIR